MSVFKKFFQSKRPAPPPVSPGKPAPKADKETENTRILIAKCLEHLIVQLQTVIPPEGRFQQNFVCFDNRIPHWYMDQCGMMIECSHTDPNKRMLRVYATYPEDDRMVSHYYKSGSNEELIQYMSNPHLVQEIYESYTDFSESIRLSD